MKSILKKIFIDNWQRKTLAFIIAIITWIFINNSLTVTKTIPNIPIKVVNLASNKIISGMQSSGQLSENTSVTLTGNYNFINKINSSDLEILLDLKDQDNNFTAHVSKEILISKNPSLNLEKSIKTINPTKIPIVISNLVTDKVPVLITKPIGEAPKGYQFLDIWPYQLFITLKGPEEIIQDLKVKGLQLTFNLNDITRNELDIIQASNKRGKKDIVSYFMPTVRKKLIISNLSPYPMEIDDPNSKALRLDFIKNDLIPINGPIPVALFFPNSTLDKFNSTTIALASNELIKKSNNSHVINTPLYAQGVSESFLEIIKDRIHIVILVDPNGDKEKLDWNVQVIIPIELENKFVSTVLSETVDEASKEPKDHSKEAYLRHLFREHMNKCRLWLTPEQKLNLKISLNNNVVNVDLDDPK